jgi:hypothetical protein
MDAATSDHGVSMGRPSRLTFQEKALALLGLVILSIPLWMRTPPPDELVQIEGRLRAVQSYQPPGKNAYLSVRVADRTEWFDLPTQDLPLVRSTLAQKGTLGFYADYSAHNRGGIRTYGLVANGSTMRSWREELEKHRTVVRWGLPFVGVSLLGLVAISVRVRRARENARHAA